ncbi:MAG: hypothetical protein ACE5HV_02565 [Acidobacteriota bacterium]
MRKLLILSSAVLVVGFGLTSLQVPGALAQEGEKAEVTLTGCLSAGETEGYFVLTDEETDEETQVEAAKEVGIGNHLGHKVKLTGSWEKKEEGEEQRHFQVTKIEHISTSCKRPGQSIR